MGPLNNNPMPNEVDMQHMAHMQALADQPERANRPRLVNAPTPQWAIDQLRALRNVPEPQRVVAADAMDIETETPPPPGQPLLPLRERGVHVETILVLVEGQPLPRRLFAAPNLRIA